MRSQIAAAAVKIVMMIDGSIISSLYQSEGIETTFDKDNRIRGGEEGGGAKKRHKISTGRDKIRQLIMRRWRFRHLCHLQRTAGDDPAAGCLTKRTAREGSPDENAGNGHFSLKARGQSRRRSRPFPCALPLCGRGRWRPGAPQPAQGL